MLDLNTESATGTFSISVFSYQGTKQGYSKIKKAVNPKKGCEQNIIWKIKKGHAMCDPEMQ